MNAQFKWANPGIKEMPKEKWPQTPLSGTATMIRRG